MAQKLNEDKPRSIYMLVNPANKKPFYVGIAVEMEDRLSGHAGSYGNDCRRQILDAILHSGMRVTMVELEKRDDERSALTAEIFWIELLRSRGNDLVNREMPEEVRLRAAATHVAACRAKPLIKPAPKPLPASVPATEPVKPTAKGQRISTWVEPELDPITLPPPAVAQPLGIDVQIEDPARHGEKWTDAEEAYLAKHFLVGVDVDQLTALHQRRRGGILSKLASLSRRNPKVFQRMIELKLMNQDGELMHLGNPTGQ